VGKRIPFMHVNEKDEPDPQMRKITETLLNRAANEGAVFAVITPEGEVVINEEYYDSIEQAYEVEKNKHLSGDIQ